MQLLIYYIQKILSFANKIKFLQFKCIQSFSSIEQMKYNKCQFTNKLRRCSEVPAVKRPGSAVEKLFQVYCSEFLLGFLFCQSKRQDFKIFYLFFLNPDQRSIDTKRRTGVIDCSSGSRSESYLFGPGCRSRNTAQFYLETLRRRSRLVFPSLIRDLSCLVQVFHGFTLIQTLLQLEEIQLQTIAIHCHFLIAQQGFSIVPDNRIQQSIGQQ
ncbi:Hypothetical_protein [Hexamita inflata]|uniref:Hypothetical_protein n=1 Tax=Hexamita inflata TaxID=28002 RepID=A0AA86UA99_9EUKA|nr:Hypothetical protein HINF_LOCUS37275 [Hexamita inflata]